MITVPNRRVAWSRMQPSSLRHAMGLCKDHAQAVHNRSVERIADLMGLADHWALYKWLQNGRMPACLIRPYEGACGIDFMTRWLSASAGKLLVCMPTGKHTTPADMVELNSHFASALQLLTNFYADPTRADPAATVQALHVHLQQVAYHERNVAAYAAPELDLQ